LKAERKSRGRELEGEGAEHQDAARRRQREQRPREGLMYDFEQARWAKVRTERLR
jgi:hypothetical protein